MANLHLVTGLAGYEHVAAADDASLNMTMFGTGEYVLRTGNKFAATLISNNSVRVSDGNLMMQGRHVRLNPGESVDLTIDSGEQGYNRNDLIVARYSRDSSTNIEQCNLVVIKGTAVTGTASDPEYTHGDLITDQDIQADMPLYRVVLSGVNIQSVVSIFTTINEDFGTLNRKQDNTNDLTAETSIADGDYFPYYDTSAGANRKTLWSNLVAKLKSTMFGTISGVVKANGSGGFTAGTVNANDISAGAITTEKFNAASVAPKATLLETARRIGRAIFDGSVDITLAAMGAAEIDGYGRVKPEQINSHVMLQQSSFTLAADMAGKFIRLYSSSDITVTLPADDTVFPIGTEIEFEREGSGVVSFSPPDGVTLASVGSMRQIADTYGVVSLKKMAANLWLLAGGLE